MSEIPSRAGKRRGQAWTEAEATYLEARLVDMSPQQVAEEMGISLKAVRHQMYKEGLGSKNGDGRFTAGEAARLLGIPTTTLFSHIVRGKVPATKVGNLWRVELSDDTQLTPAWNGHSLHRYREDISGQLDDRTDCINCNAPLKRSVASYCCSYRCKGEFMSGLYKEQVSGKEDPNRSFPPYLRVGFQNWLVDIGQLQRGAVMETRGGIRDSRFKVKSALNGGEAELRDKIKNLDLNGFAIPADYLGERQLVLTTAKSLSEKLWQPDAVTTLEAIGAVGVWVKSAKLPEEELSLLRRVWQKEKQKVALKYITTGNDSLANKSADEIVDIAYSVERRIKGSGFHLAHFVSARYSTTHNFILQKVA
jgi:excisionase family DNA binding protein